MDATVFCFAAQELAGRIGGLRLEKVFSPWPDTWTFALGRAGYLVWCADKPAPFFILTPHKPENPEQPDGQAMWLRKRLRGRFVLNLVADWPRRRLALELSPGEGTWLLLDLQGPPALASELPAGFGHPPEWPGLERIRTEPDLWRTHPHLTPPLRRYLATAGLAEASSVLDCLSGQGVPCFYCGRDERAQMQVRLWPVGGQSVSFDQALDAAEHVYGPGLARSIREQEEVTATAVRARRHLERIMTRLDEDRSRLQSMIAGRQTAMLLQEHLHTLDKSARLSCLSLEDQDGRAHEIQLDPSRTVLENMNRLFARAAKGERGLDAVAARLKSIQLEQKNVCSGQATRSGAQALAPLPVRYQNIKAALYRSSDGFLILRGRSAQANHQLLTRVASPFDYWLHALGGSGAHVIVRRDFPRQEVPEQTIQEAACLAALSSHLKLADKGDVLLCLVRDVRTIKGAAVGMVGVDKVLRTVRAAIDPQVEEKLKIRDQAASFHAVQRSVQKTGKTRGPNRKNS